MSIQNKKIEKGNVKWARCQKALYEKDGTGEDMLEKMELVDAFKIENSILLKDFERRLRK